MVQREMRVTHVCQLGLKGKLGSLRPSSKQLEQTPFCDSEQASVILNVKGLRSRLPGHLFEGSVEFVTPETIRMLCHEACRPRFGPLAVELRQKKINFAGSVERPSTDKVCPDCDSIHLHRITIHITPLGVPMILVLQAGSRGFRTQASLIYSNSVRFSPRRTGLHICYKFQRDR